MAAPTARRLILLLAALTALALTAAASVALTPAAHAAGAQNRVGAFIPGTEPLTRPAALESSCTRPGLIASTAGIAAGFCVAAEDESGVIFRTGSQTDNALTDPSGVSFRDSVSSSTDGQQVFRPGDKIYGVDTSQLPPGSVVRDGVPDGHVSVFASPQQIRDAIVPYPLDDYGLNPLADGSYRLPK